MRNLYHSKQGLWWIIVGGLAVSLLASVGCDRGDRVAVAESAAEGASLDHAAQRSKKAMYSARIEQDSVPVGEPVEVALAIDPGHDLKINLDFPWKVSMQESEAVSFTTAVFEKGDISLKESQASIPLVLNVAKAGEYDVEAIADFSVCNDDRCEILRGEKVIVKVRGVEGNAE